SGASGVVDRPLGGLGKHVVGAADEDAEQDHGEDHYERIAVELGTGWPDELAELVVNPAQELADALLGPRLVALPGGYCHVMVTWSPCELCACCTTCSTCSARSGRDRSSCSSKWCSCVFCRRHRRG